MRDSENIDLYAVLQVHPTAEPEIVDAAYRRLARMYHPDVNKAPGAHETMIRINLAYEILGDPAKRAAYDRDRSNREQTEWQAWTERAERDRRERAEREQRQCQAQAEREQREQSEQAERERQARTNAERQRADQEQAEREQRERQAQANPTHQSYAEWEAEMQRQVRAKQEASAQSQQHKLERGFPIIAAIASGAIMGSVLGATHVAFGTLMFLIAEVKEPSFYVPFLGDFVISEFSVLGGLSGLFFLIFALILSIGMPIRTAFDVNFQAPYPRKWIIFFVKVVITTALTSLSILLGLVGLLYNHEVILAVFSFTSGASFGAAGRLYYRRSHPNWLEPL